ncbi:hypothetical protein [Lentibacillus sp. CBA3610]|uniref:hypothetical protein n=1 Tax=Lentibacillus sp. CBA3610 TaxID=2518176 RepID=UPI0015960E3D|nr:hypothetical protein [Lentibacillus sp. CBA3610]QKY71312.1 hypothetical protein Len3610_18710 [Lentibacillus sp. CBA3610]
MRDKEFELVSTFLGETFKFHKNPKSKLLFELSNNNIIIGITTSISCIDCFLPDEEGIYHYAGDINFGLDDNENYINLHSRSISAISFNGEKISVPNHNDNLTNVKINLNVDKSVNWFEKLSKKF